MLKTRAVLEWEYAPHLGRTADQAIGASEDRLTWMRSAQSDYEIAMPLFEIDSFASGTGYYHGLCPAIRLEQIDHLLELCEQLYPRMRIYLFDAKRLYSAPVTIFGPLLCVFYAGSHYMAFRDRDRIETFSRHFDTLVREADVAARDFPTTCDSSERLYSRKAMMQWRKTCAIVPWREPSGIPITDGGPQEWTHFKPLNTRAPFIPPTETGPRRKPRRKCANAKPPETRKRRTGLAGGSSDHPPDPRAKSGLDLQFRVGIDRVPIHRDHLPRHQPRCV